MACALCKGGGGGWRDSLFILINDSPLRLFLLLLLLLLSISLPPSRLPLLPRQNLHLRVCERAGVGVRVRVRVRAYFRARAYISTCGRGWVCRCLNTCKRGMCIAIRTAGSV